jgi:hypothetical protein
LSSWDCEQKPDNDSCCLDRRLLDQFGDNFDVWDSGDPLSIRSRYRRSRWDVPHPIYSKWADAYSKQTGIRLNYQSIGCLAVGFQGMICLG